MGIEPFDVFRIKRLQEFLTTEDPIVVAALRTRLGLGKDEMPEIPQVQGPQPQPGPGQ